VALCPK